MDDLVLKALDNIPASACTRQEWIQVGMALKYEGYPVTVWDSWSQSDSRYKPGECSRKWDGFHGSGSPVTAGTIVQMAKDNGWLPAGFDGDELLDWDTPLEYDGVSVSLEFKKRLPSDDAIKYLETLFDRDDYVSFVTDTITREDGKLCPGGKGVYWKKAGELIDSARAHPDDLGYTFGDQNNDAGAWIRFNPFDGRGVNNENVTQFRYALVESDSISIQEQEMLYKQHQLPVAMMVHSGGKSLHAIVKIDASNKDEYTARVRKLYDYLKKNGVDIDKQNSNPSRLSRFPGFKRGDQMQRIVSMSSGRSSWASWEAYIDGSELPDIIRWQDIRNDLPPLSPEIIYGVLREGHKLMITAASKAGKSFLVTELAICLAEGEPWLGLQTKKSKVLYCNFEIDDSSFFNRINEIYNAFGFDCTGELDIWTLRGRAQTMEVFTPELIKRLESDGHYKAVIIDPIYKVQSGDENSAQAIASFTNQLDKVCSKTGCTVIYVHHHSKGDKSGAKAIDRSSGSGVFARDADALIDLTEVELSEAERSRSDYPDSKAFVMSTELREFKNMRPCGVWFNHPIHEIDDSGIIMKHLTGGQYMSGENPKAAAGRAAKSADKSAQLENAIEYLKAFHDDPGYQPSAEEISEYFEKAPGWSLKTVYKMLHERAEMIADGHATI